MLTTLIAFFAIPGSLSQEKQLFQIEPVAKLQVAKSHNADRLDGRKSGIGVRITGFGHIDGADIYSNFSVKAIPSATNPLKDTWGYFKSRRKEAKDSIARGLIEHDSFLLMPPIAVDDITLKGEPAKQLTFPFMKEADGEFLGRTMIVSYDANHVVFIDMWARTLDSKAWQSKLKRKLADLSMQLKEGFFWTKARR